MLHPGRSPGCGHADRSAPGLGRHGRFLVLHHLVRGRAAATAASVDWLANFVIVQWFPTLNSQFGLAWVMVLFAVLAVIAIGFVAKYPPETKGLPLE